MDDGSLSLLASIVRTQPVAALGTLHDGAPFVSMIAVVPDADFSSFVFLASALASHTRDVRANGRTSLMLLDHLSPASSPQSLARLSLSGTTRPLAKEENEYAHCEELYRRRFPESVDLFWLGDFSLFRFTPEAGRFVAGFAKAYAITVPDLRRASAR